MKRIIVILIIICSLIVPFSIAKINNDKISYSTTSKDNTKKEIIIANLKLLEERIELDSINNKEYKKNMNYISLINLGDETVPILIDMYKNKELNDISSVIATELIQDITNCNLKEKYNLEWNDPKQFFKLWENIPKIDEKKISNLTTDVITLASKYPDLLDSIIKSNINLPNLDNMIPQGITIMDKYFLITAYDKTGESNSKCYVLSLKGKLVNTVELDTNSHVGAIAYDSINNLIWIPENNGLLNAYDSKQFLKENKVTFKYQFDDVGDRLKNYENKLKNLIAYLCIKDNKIYIGSFDDTDKGLVKEYEIIKNKNKEIELTFVSEFKVPSKVQGIDFYTYNEETYLLLSCSYGRFNPSYIYIYKYDETKTDYATSITNKITLKLPPMLEQIIIKEDKLYTLFESYAKEYDNCIEKIGSICIFDLNKIIEKYSSDDNTIEEIKEGN